MKKAQCTNDGLFKFDKNSEYNKNVLRVGFEFCLKTHLLCMMTKICLDNFPNFIDKKTK